MITPPKLNRPHRLARLFVGPTALLGVVLFGLSLQQSALASPFGQGVFGAQVPFGSATSLSIALSGNVSLALVPSGNTFSATGSNTVTVTSTGVSGYNLYIYSHGSSSLTNGSSSILASSNGTEAPLSNGTWGYNSDNSGNYIGLTNSPVLLLGTTGPYESGNTTTVHYSALTDITTSAGTYTGNVTFTAVALSQ